jgi:signal transduction histidine kinase
MEGGLPHPFPIQRALFVGFGLVFGLWLVSGFDLVRRLTLLEERTAATAARSSRAEQLLSTVRVRVLLGSVYVRDALFDTSDEAGDYYRDQLLETRDTIAKALDQYVPVLDSAVERQQFGQLRAEVGDFWQTVLPVLGWDSTRRVTEARALLRRRVIPKRDVIIRISGRIQELNRGALMQQQEETAAIYKVMRQRMWETSGLALFASLVIAVAVTRHAGRLEARVREQAQNELQNTRDLQRLSARLVHAQEEERRTIARELHDEIGQALTAIKVELALATRNAGSTDRAEAAFREARAITDRALQQVRDLSQLLHPALLDDLGLPAALEWYLRRFSARTGVRADLLQDGMDTRLAAEIETCIYRIAQEALTNVARHAGASTCRLYLQRLPNTVLLTIEDDGRGFQVSEQAPAAGRGLGLLGIQERVSGFRGSFRCESQPGRGTRLTVELPALPRPSCDDGEATAEEMGDPAQPGEDRREGAGTPQDTGEVSRESTGGPGEGRGRNEEVTP